MPRKNILAKAFVRMLPFGHFGLGAGPTLVPDATAALLDTPVAPAVVPAFPPALLPAGDGVAAAAPPRAQAEHAPASVRRRRIQPAPLLSQSTSSFVRKKMATSRAALSGESLPWTTFIARLTARSPRMVPGRRAGGLVAPIMARTSATAPGPSHTIATTGEEVMKSTRPAKNGLSRARRNGARPSRW